MKFKYLVYFLIAIIAVFFWIYLGTNWVKITESEIVSRQLPKGISELKIIHLSDLHGKDFGNGNKIIVDTIKTISPDLIILSGDMINSHDDDGSATVSLLGSIANEYPVFYAFGNHDQYCRLNTPEVFYKYEKEVLKTGCVILDDEKIVFNKDGYPIYIYGLTSIPYKKKVNTTYLEEESFNAAFLNETIGETSPEQYELLIAHDPSWFETYREWGADFVFSGHIHGGAIRLPIIGGLVSPNHELFPKYDAGLFEENETFMYVSRGLGTSVERIRIFNRPEIVVITIKKNHP